MGYLLDWGIGSFLSVQGHRKPFSTLPSTLSFGSWEQRCICVSIVKIPMRDSIVWSAGHVSAQCRKIISTYQLCIQQREFKVLSDDNTNTVDSMKYCEKCFIHKLLCEIISSYLTSLLLPEDSRLRVSFGFTREGGSAPLGHNLVPWTDDKLGRSWRTGQKHQC